MNIKLFELRDKGTFIPIFAFKPADAAWIGAESYLVRRSGFGPTTPCVIMGRLECKIPDCSCCYDPYSWGDRTFHVAHKYIEENWDQLTTGQVIDVEFILGETKVPKQSEMLD